MTALAPVARSGGLTFAVLGTPKTKGSLRHVGGSHFVEQVAGSGAWRQMMVAAMRQQMRMTGIPQINGPVAVEVVFTVPKPKSAPRRVETWPVSQRSGDLDKLIRNLGDAMKDAKLVKDDALIVSLVAVKVYPGQSLGGFVGGELPGVVVDVRPAL